MQNKLPWWKAPKAARALFLIALILLSGTFVTTTTGCGGAGVLIAGICVPCGVVIAVVAGVALGITAIFINHGDGPDHPTPPPKDPPDVATNSFVVELDLGSECPIDGITVEDPTDPTDIPQWVFGGPQGMPDPSANAPAGSRMALDAEHMIWPALGRNLNESLIRFGDALGADWVTDEVPVHIVINFNGDNPNETVAKTLDISDELVRLGYLAPGQHPVIHHGTHFKVKWDSVNGARLISFIP